MAIDQLMYFALGFLIALLLAIMIVPSVWKRAVRLTKTRIEAATPITMAEFRADKDQLRAEFALSTRRLETTIETLRTRLAEQLGDLNIRSSDLAIMRAETNQHEAIVDDLTARETQALDKMHGLERELAGLAQQLRMRDLDLTELQAELRLAQAAATMTNSTAAAADIRQSLADETITHLSPDGEIDQAQARISNAGNRLNALLEETGLISAEDVGPASKSLAQKLSEEDRVGDLQDKIVSVEDEISRHWEDGTVDKSGMRDRLGEIASLVSQLVYATDADAGRDAEESLFDRVQKFAGQDLAATRQNSETDKVTASRRTRSRRPVLGGTVSDRLAAFEDIHANN